MKKTLILSFLLCLNLVFSQGEANIWYFGGNAGLDFNTGVATPLYDGELNTLEGCATISNAAGQLLFYTDGVTVYDKTHQIMQNGTGLLGHPSSTQSAIIVPNPSNPNIYYIFTTTELLLSEGVRYSEVDLSLNGGLGAVTVNKNILLLSGEVTEKLTSVKHANGQDYWVMCHDYANDTYHAFAVTSSGVNMSSITSNIGSVLDTTGSKFGYLKFSADASMLANAVPKNSSNSIELFDFNSATGILSNLRVINCEVIPYGIEFSASGDILYITRYQYVNFITIYFYLVQYDLTSSNIETSEQIIYSGVENVNYNIGALQMAPDGKIYLANENSQTPNHFISCIVNPEVLGSGCNFQLNAVNLGTGICKVGLPQFIQSYFNVGFNVTNTCLGDVTAFTPTNTTSVTSATWNFGDGNSSTAISPTHTYANPGTYTVSATFSNGTQTTSHSKQVTISEVPIVATAITNQNVCGAANFSYDLAQFNTTILGSQSTATFGVAYFASMADAVSHSHSVATNQLLTFGTHTFFAKVYNLSNTNCYAIDDFEVTLYEQPTIGTTTPFYICETVPYNGTAIFDLSTKNNEVLNGQNPANFAVSYHPTLADANANTNVLPILYSNSLPSETLHVRIQNNLHPACYATTTLNLQVAPQPQVFPVTHYTLCDDSSNDEVATFTLPTKDIEILNGQASSLFSVSYYHSLLEAQNNTNSITTPINNTSQNQTIYFAITSNANANCKVISSFELVVSKMPIANTLSDYVICENAPYDAIEQFNLGSKNGALLNGQNPLAFTISYHPSATDATNNLNVLPNLYTNTFATETLYARIQNNSNSNCFATTPLTLKVVQEPSVITISDYQVCDDASNDGFALFDLSTKTVEILNGQPASVFEVHYYLTLVDAQNNTNEVVTPITNTIANQQVFYTIGAIGNANCKVISSFYLKVNSLPVANAITNYFQCDDASNDGIATFNLTTKNTEILGSQNATLFDVFYFGSLSDAQNNTNVLPNTFSNTSNPQTLFARIHNNQNASCYAITNFQIRVHTLPFANTASNLITCDDSTNDGQELFDLASQNSAVLGTQNPALFTVSYHNSIPDAQAGMNPLVLNYENTVNPQTIYARVTNNANTLCYAISNFDLEVKNKPFLNMESIYAICEGSTVEVNAPTGFSTYQWSTGESTSGIVVNTPGNYFVTVTQDYGTIQCDNTQNFTVFNSNVATITSIMTQDWTTSENTITVLVSGDGDYEFSLNGIDFQDSNQFTGLPASDYTVSVRDKKGCGTVSEEVFLLSYPKYFTPNGDGINDYWQINFSHIEPNMKISIFDRYGKLITNFNGNSVGWDGKYNQNPLPSSDYWFSIKRENGKEFKGHFSLKR